MHNEDHELQSRLLDSQRHVDGAVPDFGSVMSAAEQQIRVSRRNRFTGFAAAAAIAAVALAILPGPEESTIYVNLEELTTSTSWTAPSDSLFPEYQFDIYRDLPRLIESTESHGGTLL